MSRPPSIVPCIAWAKRGVAKRNPDKIQLDKDELKRLISEAQDALSENSDSEVSADENVEGIKETRKENASSKTPEKRKKGKEGKKKEEMSAIEEDDLIQKYGLDDYDDEEDEGKHPLSGIGGVCQFVTNEEDPYVTLKNDDDSDNEDNELKPTDNLIINGRHHGDSCILEVHVYNEDHGSMYIHHDYLLPSFPLAVEWMNYDVADESMGNFVALGTMEPVIEIWDLDVMEALEPVARLGEVVKKGKKAKKKASVGGHTDAVLDLSWNHNVRNVLASASADFTAGVWDLSEGKMVTQLTQHKEKVQCVNWHPQEAQTLLTGSFDQTVKVFDCRSPTDSHTSWSAQGEVERAIWNLHDPIQCLATTDQGMIYCIDIRNEKPVFSLSAHDKAITGVCYSSQISGLLVTASEDKTMKVWDIQGNKPSCILSRNLRMGQIHCVGCCPEAPFVFAFGGEGQVKVWDIRESAAVRKHFLNRMPAKLAQECEGDEGDVKEHNNDDPAEAMERLNVDEEEDILGQAPSPSKKKKRKKKPKRKGLVRYFSGQKM